MLASVVPLLDGEATGSVDGDAAFSQFLPGMVDLHGSVDLSRALEGVLAASRDAGAAPREGGAVEGNPEVSGPLEAETSGWVEEKLRSLEEDKERVFAGLVDISSPELALRSLNGMRQGASAARAARDVAAPLNRFFDTQFWSLRRAFEEIRAGLKERLHEQGPAAKRLELLDAALEAATRDAAAGLRTRMIHAVHERTVEDATLAIRALQGRRELSEIETWFRPSGWVWGTRRRYGRALRALFEHDAARLLALSQGVETRRTT